MVGAYAPAAHKAAGRRSLASADPKQADVKARPPRLCLDDEMKQHRPPPPLPAGMLDVCLPPT